MISASLTYDGGRFSYRYVTSLCGLAAAGASEASESEKLPRLAFLCAAATAPLSAARAYGAGGLELLCGDAKACEAARVAALACNLVPWLAVPDKLELELMPVKLLELSEVIKAAIAGCGPIGDAAAALGAQLLNELEAVGPR